ncbi:MAG TPA: RIP metalloprotease RseP [Chthoniobacteraceae bacterium]|nr:RIP metalloprotease RseP [Chthoniobacteraceae bacterium]
MAFKILNFLFVLLEVVVLFNIIIIVHELGHFLAARWRGLHVEGFGVWFGKPIWQKEINGVVYSLGSIPAGGFVKLPQLAPMDIIEGESDTPREKLPTISALDKIIVAFAGPLFSFGLAILLACAVWAVGRPVSEIESTTVVGLVQPGMPGEKAGFQPGDKILEVDGNPVKRFHGMVDSVTWFIVRSEGEKIEFKIERGGREMTLESGWVRAPSHRFGREGLRQVGLIPEETHTVGKVEAGSPAAEAGLQPGDVVTHLDGTAVFSPFVLIEAIEKDPNAPLYLTLRRGETWLNVTVVPKVLPVAGSEPRARIGIQWDPGRIVLAHPSPKQQIADSVTTIGNMLDALFSPKSDVKAQHFSGPVGIGRLYYDMLQNENGWRLALWFSVFFNVNLAILNLLPLPVLDGGHIVLAMIESIRRRPVNIRLLEIVQSACALLIIGYMLYVTFFDVQDLPWRRLTGSETTETQPAASPAPATSPAE